MPAMAIVGVLNASAGVDDHGGKIRGVEEEAAEYYRLKGVRHLSDAGITKLPAPYVLPPSDRPSSSAAAIFPSSGAATNNNNSAAVLHLPVIDLAHLCGAGGPSASAAALRTLDAACREHGFFHLTNHGVSASGAAMLDVARRFFFDLPFSERAKLMSADVRAPVRYGTSFNQARDAVLCWRDFLKLNCGAQSAWPDAPGDLREVAGRYAADCRRVSAELVAAAMEALGIAGGDLLTESEEGSSQMLTVNCYPACPEPEKTLGMPPHSDYGLLTLVLQDDVAGLQVMRQSDGEWLTVDPLPGSFVVNVGDHFEIYSNGRYKSVLHRVRVNSARPRISVASFHSVAADRAVGPAPELLAGGEPPRYMDTDFATFLVYIASAEGKHKTFLESRRLHV